MSSYYIYLGTTIFLIGCLGIILNRKNLILLLMSLEILLLSLSFLLLFFSSFLDSFLGQFFSLYLLTLSAAESALGLGIFIAYYRVRGSISLHFLSLLKG